MLVAANVREVMGRQMLTQADMARILDLSRSGASKRWRGVTPFTLHDLGILSRRLNVPLARFMRADDEDLRARRDSNSQPSDPKSDASDETPYGTVVPLRTWPVHPVLTFVRGRAS